MRRWLPLWLCLVGALGALGGAAAAQETKRRPAKRPAPKRAAAVRYDRLPPNVAPETEVLGAPQKGARPVVTAEARLRELRAVYRKGVLVDGRGREIRFFEPLCRGVSAGAEEDAAERRAKDAELAALRKKYAVIELYCNPGKAF